MKKLCVALMGVLVLVTGCGSELSSLDIKKASNAIEQSLKDMTVVEDETLESVYGLDLSLMDEYIFKDNKDGDIYAIIKTSNKVEVKEDMEGYFEKIKGFSEAYAPERMDILEDRLEKEIGDYLIYIVAEDTDDIYDDVINTME